MVKTISPIYQKNGWYLPKIQKEVYSFEGFCHQLYHHIEAFDRVVADKKYLTWIRDTLGLEEIGKAIEDLYGEPIDMKAIMLGIISLCPVVAINGLEYFSKSYETYKKEPEHIRLKRRGNDLYAQGHYVMALKMYKAAQKCCFDPLVANNLGVVQMALNNYEGAIKAFDLAIKDSNDLNVYLNKLNCYLVLDHYDESLELLNTIQPLFDDPRIWYYYGTVYSNIAHYEEALTAYTRAYEQSGEPKVLKALALLELKTGMVERAQKRLEAKVLGVVDQTYVCAQISKYLQQWSDYILNMEKTIRVSGNEWPYILELSQYYSDNSQLIKAIDVIRQVNEKDYELDEIQLQMALITKQAGDHKAYEMVVEEMLNQWKNEVRCNIMN